MKSFFLIFFFSTVLHAEIILPPDPGKENDKTLMGIDSNNNNVRDDLEIFVYKEITKDEKLFRAYLNYFESELMMMKYADDITQVRKYYLQKIDDVVCINSMKKMGNEVIRKIIKKIHNTSIRKQVQEKIEKNWNDMVVPYRMVDLDKRHLKCR